MNSAVLARHRGPMQHEVPSAELLIETPRRLNPTSFQQSVKERCSLQNQPHDWPHLCTEDVADVL